MVSRPPSECKGTALVLGFSVEAAPSHDAEPVGYRELGDGVRRLVSRLYRGAETHVLRLPNS